MKNKVYVIRFDKVGTAYIEIINYATYQQRCELTKNDSSHCVYDNLDEAQEIQYQLNRL